jgi:threonine/homoserine/homoserine lactone efflux protein
MEIILNGFISGIVLAFLIGPVFFTILQTSIERGFWSGVFVAIGVSVSDMLYITVVYLGLFQFMRTDKFRHYMAYIGGVILLLFGIYYLFIKSRKLIHFNTKESHSGNWLKLTGKGFIINALSPMVLFFWVATVGVATSRFGYTTTTKASLFFASIVVTVLVTDILKAKLADRLRLLITPAVIRMLNIAFGLVLVLFAIRLIFFGDSM